MIRSLRRKELRPIQPEIIKRRLICDLFERSSLPTSTQQQGLARSRYGGVIKILNSKCTFDIDEAMMGILQSTLFCIHIKLDFKWRATLFPNYCRSAESLLAQFTRYREDFGPEESNDDISHCRRESSCETRLHQRTEVIYCTLGYKTTGSYKFKSYISIVCIIDSR